MSEVAVTINELSLNYPVFLPNQQRLLKRPKILAPVGAPLSDVSGKVYVNALTNLSFSIEKGHHLGLIGHNGAGKSTLLRVIAGIYPPSSGTVVTSGTIGCLFEVSAGVMPEMTGREIIKHFLLVRRGLHDGWAEIAEEVTQFTELGEFIDLPMRTYSDGMRSRLIAALATAWPHDILLLDEGLGAGDASFHAKFEARLNKYMDTAHLLVLASHSAALLKTYCKFGLVLHRGEKKFLGDIDEAQEFYESGKAAA